MLSSLLLLGAVAGSLAAPVAAPVELSRRATAVNYNQNYVASGASVTYTPNQSAGSFSVSWNTKADFVVGLGWTKGDATPVSYDGSFSVTSGTPGGVLAIYGWTTSPLVEYYIVENHGSGYSTGGSKKGSLTSDGSSYDVWEHTQTNQPSIQGTNTFNQYISVRSTPRTSGTVTIQNHFDAWSSFGLNLGTHNYQVLAVESWSGAGSAKFSVSKGTSAGSSAAPASSAKATSTKAAVATSTKAASSPATSAPASGGAGVAKFGQCGGQGYTGSTTCASGTKCTASNQWYSQCL